jgi:hypothetical protein
MPGTLPVNTLLDTNSVRIEEIINKSIGVFAPSCSKFWEDHIISNSSIAPSGDIGRDYKILKTFQGSLAGVIDPGGPTNDFALYGDTTTDLGSKLFMQGLSNTFPDPRRGMNAKTYRLGIPLRTMNANIMLTLGELQAEATPALIGEIIAPKFTGFARNMALFLCNSFYTSQNNTFQLTSLLTGNFTYTDNGTVNSTMVIDTTYTNYAVDRFQVGMQCSLFDATGATERSTTAATAGLTMLVVKAVDELTGKVYFGGVKKTDFSVLTDMQTIGAATTDIIVPYNLKGTATTPWNVDATNYFTGIAGIRSWMKPGDASGNTYNAANTLLGAEADSSNRINVNTHPEFKSMTVSMGGAAMTEHKLRQILRRFHMAKGKYGKSIDTLLASDGVWLAYEQTKIGREIIDRTGGLSSLNNQGSAEGFTFQMDGRTYKGLTDSFIESGVMYGIKGGSNWKRYVPNEQKGVSRFDKADAWVPFRFVASALGMPGNKIPIQSASGNFTMVTEGAQMPGHLRMQLVPEQPDGIIIDSCGEDRLYSSI